MNLENCALCGEKAEYSDACVFLKRQWLIVQCSNGACRQSAWGPDYWNVNQEKIRRLVVNKYEAEGKILYAKNLISACLRDNECNCSDDMEESCLQCQARYFISK